MKKQFILSLAAASTLIAAESSSQKEGMSALEKAFSMGEVKGQIRAIYQSNSKVDFGDLDGIGVNTVKSTSDFLIGGKIGFETYPIGDVSVGATFYTSQPISKNKNFKDPDYYSAGSSSGYAILGESFIKYKDDDAEIKIGRMELDLPLVNSDDIRMVPNLYTAAMATYKPIKGLSLTAGVVTQMAGWENSSEHTKFEKMGNVVSYAVADGGVWDTFFADNSSALDSKLYLGGISYEHDKFSVQGWYSRQTDLVDTYYAEGSFKAYNSEALAVNLVAQYMKEKAVGKLKTYSEIAGNEITKVDANIYGLALELESADTGLKGSIAYNRSGKKEGAHNNGGTASFFGGGKDPLLTSMDVVTANGAGDVAAYKYEVGYDFEKVGAKGLSATLAHAEFKYLNASDISKKDTARETDFVVAYSINKEANIELMLTKISITGAEDNSRFRVYAKYDF